MAFNKPYLPDYFDESALPKEDKYLITQEKALQKALSKNNMVTYHIILDECQKGWRKYLNTEKMKSGRVMSERAYQVALSNLQKIKG